MLTLYVVVEMADDISKMRCGHLPSISEVLGQEFSATCIAAWLPVPRRPIHRQPAERGRQRNVELFTLPEPAVDIGEAPKIARGRSCRHRMQQPAPTASAGD
jgi:hypothetical protein